MSSRNGKLVSLSHDNSEQTLRSPLVVNRNRAAPGGKETAAPSRKNSTNAGSSSKPSKKVSKGPGTINEPVSASLPMKKARRMSDASGMGTDFGALSHFETGSS
jgi:hypothetical protein